MTGLRQELQPAVFLVSHILEFPVPSNQNFDRKYTLPRLLLSISYCSCEWPIYPKAIDKLSKRLFVVLGILTWVFWLVNEEFSVRGAVGGLCARLTRENAIFVFHSSLSFLQQQLFLLGH